MQESLAASLRMISLYDTFPTHGIALPESGSALQGIAIPARHMQGFQPLTRASLAQGGHAIFDNSLQPANARVLDWRIRVAAGKTEGDALPEILSCKP